MGGDATSFRSRLETGFSQGPHWRLALGERLGRGMNPVKVCGLRKRKLANCSSSSEEGKLLLLLGNHLFPPGSSSKGVSHFWEAEALCRGKSQPRAVSGPSQGHCVKL